MLAISAFRLPTKMIQNRKDSFVMKVRNRPNLLNLLVSMDDINCYNFVLSVQYLFIFGKSESRRTRHKQNCNNEYT